MSKKKKEVKIAEVKEVTPEVVTDVVETVEAVVEDVAPVVINPLSSDPVEAGEISAEEALNKL